MILENLVSFPFCSRLWFRSGGFGAEKMVMPEGGKENIVGPQLLVLPDGTSKYFDPAMHVRVTDRLENLNEGIVRIKPTELTVVGLSDPDGYFFRLYLWHYKLIFP
jgi:hypothetical protein